MSDVQDELLMASSETIGPYLKKFRENQGLSLDQVASLTRIQSKFLQALEEEDFEQLPEQVFVRGFVRTYARSLGINEEDTLRRFSESSSEFYQQGQQAQYQAQLQIQEEKRGKLNRNLVVIITIAIIVALGFLLPREQQSSPPSEPLDEARTPSTAPAPTPVETPKEETVPEMEPSPPAKVEEVAIVAIDNPPTVVEPAPVAIQTPVQETPVPPTPISTDPLRLEIEATQLTWVVVKSDEESPKEALLQPGQKADWEARQQFTLTLGNAAGVAVRLNGETRGPFGKPGEVVREVVLKP